MGEKVRVASIAIQYPDGERKELTVDDAKELYSQLCELFGENHWVPNIPLVIERGRWPRWEPVMLHPPSTAAPVPELHKPQIWCSAASG